MKKREVLPVIWYVCTFQTSIHDFCRAVLIVVSRLPNSLQVNEAKLSFKKFLVFLVINLLHVYDFKGFYRECIVFNACVNIFTGL